MSGKGGGGGGLLLFGGLAILSVGGYLYLNGRLPGFGRGTGNVTTGSLGWPFNEIRDVLEMIASNFSAQNWPAIAIPCVLAAILFTAWRRIGGYGRGLVMVTAAIVVTVWVVRQ